ncbi:hypothetical protein Daus18300_011897 [Diaporthe australafricana]|uniref:Erythromycin biosynthesis protein CIII-like C-terminal domain-containing protein n=1 Tax=Diaporthe australafricana TaxID=127596 RepID=A0ABR3W4Q7_9PEZI
MSTTDDTTDMKPLILYALPNADGHMYPANQITEQLISRGFDVTMVAAAKWQSAAGRIGAGFAPLVGLWAREDFRDSIMDKKVTDKTRLKALRQSIGDTFVSMMFSGYQSLVLALVELQSRVGNESLKKRGVVILSDMCFTGVLPFKLGADLFSDLDIKTICIALLPRAWATPETPCWGAGLPWDPSEAGLKRNTIGNKMGYDEVQHNRLDDALFMAGCKTKFASLWEEHDKAYLPEEYAFRRSLGNGTYFAHNTVFQMCIPSVEYPAANLPAHFKFGGQLPPKPIPSDLQYPEWWGEVLENSATKQQGTATRKKIVFVAQGTESPNHEDLVVPAIQGLASRDDVLVVACLCRKGAELALTNDLPHIPANTRVIDFFPYDAVLAHADLFISSSGYGGLNHAVVNGVPVVQTGILIDKPDVGRRIEYAGLGVFIPQFPPPADKIRDSVDKVISDEKYRTRALQLQAEAETYNPFEIIEKEILNL